MQDNNNFFNLKDARDKFLNNYGLIFFKLLNDSLLLLLVFFLFLVIADGILPGFISNYYNPAIVALLILINILLLSFLEKKINLNLEQADNKKAIFYTLPVIIILIFITFFRLNIWLNLFLTLASLSVGCFVYKLFSEE